MLAVCDGQGLIEREMFPIDGVKLPSNASKQRSGTRAEKELLLPVVEALATTRTSATVRTADAGSQSDANLAALAVLEVSALIADPNMPTRDERFADREQYGQRFATVEPVLANVRYNKRLDRFTLPDRTNVNGQWLLFCLMHHIEKLTQAESAA